MMNSKEVGRWIGKDAAPAFSRMYLTSPQPEGIAPAFGKATMRGPRNAPPLREQALFESIGSAKYLQPTRFRTMAVQGSGTVAKALSLLDIFLSSDTELTATQLSTRLGMNLTTATRLCMTLEKFGLLTRSQGRAYKLGPKVWQLSQAYRRTFRLEELIRPLIRDIRDKTGESVAFYVVEGSERLCLFRENSKSTIRHHVDEGSRLPLTTGVVGPVLLAFAGKEGPEYERIRRAGHLIAQGREPHTTSVSIPVHDGQGLLRGALVVSGLSVRFTQDRIDKALELLREAANRLNEALPSSE
jgi:DNA-binding IclR family transcriptional regulator